MLQVDEELGGYAELRPYGQRAKEPWREQCMRFLRFCGFCVICSGSMFRALVRGVEFAGKAIRPIRHFMPGGTY